MSDEKTYFKLCPELGDGQHHEITPDAVTVLDRVEAWLVQRQPGEFITIEVMEITGEAFENLKDI